MATSLVTPTSYRYDAKERKTGGRWKTRDERMPAGMQRRGVRPSHLYAERMIACYEGNKARRKPRIRPDCDTSLVSASGCNKYH